MNSVNSGPRGAASTAAGNKVWVVDANRKVFVYNAHGTLLGSWTPGSLNSSSIVEGITVHGNDVWIVDNKTDKVYKYAGAANRLAGSHPASADPIPLASDNRNPKDLVTDGTYIWVVNDSTTDKVFKYTALDNFPVPEKPAGTLLGSWTIDSANKTPTGLTIDPTGASQSIWIVDSVTDKVYEYTNARSRTIGSQSAEANPFALAAGNTNPQGIADPPPAASKLTSPGARVAIDRSIAEVEKPNRKTLTSSDSFIAQVDSIFENWNENSVSNQTKRRLTGRR